MVAKRNRRKACIVLLLIIVAFFSFSRQETARTYKPAAMTIEQKMKHILTDVHLEGAVIGISIRRADTGELLYSKNGDTRLHPASNMKLLTSVAALETLGPDYRFTTEVWTDGTIKGKMLNGNLYLKGKGDPTLLEKDLDQFAANLKKQGIHKIKGNVIGDDTWYDAVRLSQDLNWSDESFHTGAQISALTLSPDTDYDAGTVMLQISPASKRGSRANIRMLPENNYVQIVNKTKMAAETETKNISIEREHGSNTVVVTGTMPLNGTNTKSHVSVWEPTNYTLALFKKALRKHNIAFIDSPQEQTGKVPTSARLLTSNESIPLAELLIPFMKLSNNGHGEILAKEMGKVINGEGSWSKGLPVIEKTMTVFGVKPNTILLRDGSGMSHKNYLPANEISQLLFAVQQKSWFPAFLNSLPQAGETDRFTGGTLRYRMTDSPVKGNVTAKTGSLTGVSALSGYVTTKDGNALIFSIIINNYIGDEAPIKQIEDIIATTLADHTF